MSKPGKRSPRTGRWENGGNDRPSAFYSQQTTMYGDNLPRHTDWRVDDATVFELMSHGFSGDDVAQLDKLLDRAAAASMPFIWYRPQAVERGAARFAFNRCYKKSHEVGSKRMPGTVVWDRKTGWQRPFPEAKS